MSGGVAGKDPGRDGRAGAGVLAGLLELHGTASCGHVRAGRPDPDVLLDPAGTAPVIATIAGAATHAARATVAAVKVVVFD